MFSSSAERHLKGPVCTGFPSCPSSPPCNRSAGSPLGVGLPGGVCFHLETLARTQTHNCSRRNKGRKWATVRGGARVFGVQWYSNPFCCDKVCQSSCSGCHSQRQHTHTLKMEVRDQSSDGQVGESERYLMDCGRRIGTRRGALLWFL